MFLESLQQWVSDYGTSVIFIVLYFESLGAPLPGETLLITGSILASTGHLNVITLIIFSYIAVVVGDCTGYLIGKATGKKLLLRYGHLVKLTPERLEKFENAMRKHGFYFVATARFIPVARQLNGVIAGASNMPFYKFLIANATGAIVWIGCWGLGPYFLKHLFVN